MRPGDFDFRQVLPAAGGSAFLGDSAPLRYLRRPSSPAFLPQRPFSGGAFLLEARGPRVDLGAVRLEHSRGREGCRSSLLGKPAFLAENRGRRRSEGPGEPAPACLLCEYLGDSGEKDLDRREMLFPFSDGPIR